MAYDYYFIWHNRIIMPGMTYFYCTNVHLYDCILYTIVQCEHMFSPIMGRMKVISY